MPSNAQRQEATSVVYIIDDEEATRSSLKNLLRSVGFTVRSFEGTAAFKASEKNAGPSCMLLDVRVTLQNIWVAVILVALVAAKTFLIFGIARLFGASNSVALRTGLALGACGEFGFVLLAHANNTRLLSPEILQPVLAAMVLSMLAAPFIIQRSEAIVRRLNANEWMMRAMQLHNIAVQSMAASEHVLICGYGRTGQNLARFLEHENTPVIALDIDPERIREAAAAGEHVVFGDAARREVLVAAGLMRAKVLAVTYADTASALRILEHAHALRPDLPVVVRTQDDTDIDKLKAAGAAEVVSEIMEGSLMLASTTLMLIGTRSEEHTSELQSH